MSASVRFVGYRDKKGFVVRGGPKVEPSRTDRHMARSFYLVSQLEAANWGTVQNYDGAGMSAGPLHVIAVFPATGDQGPLWRMVRRIFDTSSTASTDALKRRLAAVGWNVAADGTLRDGSGAKVSGAAIKEQLSGPNGRVPDSGPIHDRAKAWALAFHEAFSDPSSYPGQYEGTVDWLTGNFDTEADAYRKYVRGLTGSDADIKQWVRTASLADVGPYLDLAMAVYHAFSVNAPGKAKQILQRVLGQNLDVRDFAKALTRQLGEDFYGNWRERGRKTMIAVARSGLWPPDVVKDVYPDAQAASMIAYATESAPFAFGGLVTIFALGAAGYFLFRSQS
jgi:hypothetical protein